ncbi:hypothetical protein D3C75_1258830 [compost metagenome]
MARLANKGWTTEAEVVEEIIRKSKYSNVKQLVGQLRPLITDGKYYTLQTVNNELRKQLKLPENIRARCKIIAPIERGQGQGVTDQISDGS